VELKLDTSITIHTHARMTLARGWVWGGTGWGGRVEASLGSATWRREQGTSTTNEANRFDIAINNHSRIHLSVGRNGSFNLGTNCSPTDFGRIGRPHVNVREGIEAFPRHYVRLKSRRTDRRLQKNVPATARVVADDTSIRPQDGPALPKFSAVFSRRRHFARTLAAEIIRRGRCSTILYV
jgi:hypothetical protein